MTSTPQESKMILLEIEDDDDIPSIQIEDPTEDNQPKTDQKRINEEHFGVTKIVSIFKKYKEYRPIAPFECLLQLKDISWNRFNLLRIVQHEETTTLETGDQTSEKKETHFSILVVIGMESEGSYEVVKDYLIKYTVNKIDCVKKFRSVGCSHLLIYRFSSTGLESISTTATPRNHDEENISSSTPALSKIISVWRLLRPSTNLPWKDLSFATTMVGPFPPIF